MNWLSEFARRVGLLFHGRKFDREMEEEMRLHLELREREHAANGLSTAEAHTAAKKHFGNALALREASHDSWGWAWLDHLAQDLRFAFRMLRKSPGFAATVILTLALGIGANTAIFSVIEAVFLRPLPYPQANQLVYALWDGSDGAQDSVGAADYLFWKEHTRAFESAGAYQPESGSNLVAGGQARFVRVTKVSPGMFSTLGIHLLLGRDFAQEEGQLNGPHAIILSYGLWSSLFSAKAQIIGHSIEMNGQSYAVVGVMPRDFEFVAAADVYTPLQLVFEPGDHDQNYGMVARLRPGVSLGQAQAEMGQVFGLFKRTYPEAVWQGWEGLSLISYRQELMGNVRTPLLVLFGAVSLVLLIAIANVISLFLGRASARQGEIAVRVAIGASRGRVLRQLATEGVLVAILGGGVGLLLADWSLRWLLALIPQTVSIDLSTSLLPLGSPITLNTTVLMFTLIVSVVAGLAAGLFPYLRVRVANLYGELKGGGRDSGLDFRSPRARNVLVTTEIAIAVVLFVGAGLLTQSFLKLRTVNPGFNPRRLSAVEMSLPPQKYTTTTETWSLQQRVMQKLEAIPGVTGVATTSNLPVLRGLRYPYEIPGCERFMVELRAVSPSYFRVMGIPLLEGRGFTDTDKAGSAVVNGNLAHRCWPNRSAVGESVGNRSAGVAVASQVIGVVGDTKEGSLDSPALPVVYVPAWSVSDGLTQAMHGWFLSAWVIRSGAQLNRKTIDEAVASVDSTLPVAKFEPMTELIANSFALAQSRLLTVLLDAFTGLALVLALIGIYGLLSYLVSRCSHEIGVRMALGARPADVLRLVIGQGLKLAGIGIAVGIALALVLTRLMASLLYGVSASDPTVFAGVAILLVIVAIAACYVPARRAAKIDPMIALRYE